MKSAIAAIAILMSSLTASAQTATTVHYPTQVSVTLNVPCAYFGRGQMMTLSANWETMFHTVVVNGKENGFFLKAGKTLSGVGATNGRHYYADGTINQDFTGFVPATGDGVYVITTNLQIVSTVGTQETERFIYHLKQRFTVSNNGNTFTSQPDEVVCK